MRTVDQVTIRAPLERVLQLASDVERWPAILSHYRWVRFLERRNGGGPRGKAGWGPLGVFPHPPRWGSQLMLERPGRRKPLQTRPGAVPRGGAAWRGGCTTGRS